MNAHTDSTAAPAAAIEHPAQAVKRLCRELSAALNDFEGGTRTAVVMADQAAGWPIQIIISRHHNAIIRALFDYKAAYDAREDCTGAHAALIACFDRANYARAS